MKIAYSGAHFTKQSHADTAGCNVYIQSGYLMMLTVKSPNRHTVKCYRRPWVVIQININIQLEIVSIIVDRVSHIHRKLCKVCCRTNDVRVGLTSVSTAKCSGWIRSR